jgi:ankyrin repeat protein
MTSPLAPGVWGLLVLTLLPALSPAAAPPPTRIERLIDQLVHVHHSDYGYSSTVSGSRFLPLDREGQLQVGMLFQPAPTPSDTLRELVRLGAAAVPPLVAHLRDTRPTRLVIKHPLGGGTFLGPGSGLGLDLDPIGGRRRDPSYTLTVADLCYVALGQIINRDHPVVCYIPSGIVAVSPIEKAPGQIADLTRQWGRLTPARHRAALVADVRRGLDEDQRIGACKRLAYYYPETLEPLALQLLSLPTYDDEAVRMFVTEQLYHTRDIRAQRRLFQAFVRKHGQTAREGILRHLFADLWLEEQVSPLLRDSDEDVERPRRLLVGLLGQRPGVRGADRPVFLSAISWSEKQRLAEEVLVHTASKKIDRAVRDFLASLGNSDIDDIQALACIAYLAGRGFDADIEKYYRRRHDQLEDKERESVRDRLGWTPLHAAVAHGQGDLVRRLLAGGARADARSRNGDTPLHLAVRAGDDRLLTQLLGRKVNTDVKGRTGLTPIQEAARKDRDDAVLLLRKHGASVPDILVAAITGQADLIDRFARADPASLHETTEMGRTPLLLAVTHGHTTAVQRLLARGAAVRQDSWQPLHEAAARGHVAVARLLLAHRAEVDARQKGTDVTPLHLAAGHGHPDLVRLLLEKGARVDRPDKEGRTALFHAAAAGQEGVVALLLKHGAKPRLPAKDGELPLHAAVSAGRPQVIALLLRAGADLEAQDKSTGETALHRAAREGRVDAARLLLDRGARTDARDAGGNTPLHLAVSENQDGLTRLLLARKADVEALNKLGATPLHVAACFGCTRPADRLLAHKANVERWYGELLGGTPLRLAIRQGHTDMVRLLLARKANPLSRSKHNTALHEAALWDRVEIARILLDRGIPVDVKDRSGQTPLHVAVSAPGHTDALARLLLHRKANFRAVTKEGRQPLHIAALRGNAWAIGLLLDHKADVNATDKEGKTPLHLAVENESPLEEGPTESQALSVVPILLQRKADPTIKDNKGRTALALALERTFVKLAQLLRQHAAQK